MSKGSLQNSDTYRCYVPLFSIANDYTIFEVGYEKCQPLHFWGPFEKNGYVFHYCKRGKGVLKIKDRVYNVNEGDIFYIAPDDRCFYQADKEDPWEYEWIYFGGIKAKSLVSKTVFCDAVRVLPCLEPNKLSNIINSIFRKESSEVNDLHAMSKLYSFFGWLLKNYVDVKHNKKMNSSEKYWLQILNYIYINLSNDLTVTKICKAIGLERSYVYKLFLKNAGVSTIEFIEHLRIGLACDKILEGNKSFSEIAFEVGFKDYSWFSKMFKRIVGVSPSEYVDKSDDIKSTPTFRIVQDRMKDYYKFFNLHR